MSIAQPPMTGPCPTCGEIPLVNEVCRCGRPVCDRCAAPAISSARDIIRVDDGGRTDRYKRYAPVGKMRWGCALHPVESREL